MALPSSGSMSLSQINTELGNPSTQSLSFSNTPMRNLFARFSGSLSYSNGYGRERITTISLNLRQGYGQGGLVYTNFGPYNIQGKTVFTGTNLQSVQDVSGTLGNEYHNGADVEYSYDGVNWGILCTIGGYAFPMNGSSDNRGSTAFTASASVGISSTYIYLRVGTTTERQAYMNVTGTLTLQ